MADAPAAGVDHHAHLAGEQLHRLGGRRFEDLVNHLDLDEVVAGPEAAELRGPS